MADNKLEQMLEKLVNNDRAGADELFHEFVIEKSRGIYEKMLETDLEDLEVAEETDEEVDETTDEEVDEATDEEVDEASDDEDLDETTDEEVEENFGEFTPEADPMGGDATDDMLGDIEADGDEMDMGDDGEEEIEDRVVDLEDALDDLKAEFERMMSGEEGEPEMDDDDAADIDDEEEGPEDEQEEAFAPSELSVDQVPAYEGTKSAGEQMREYVEKVSPKMGDNGANAKSVVAGKNDMGGSTANLVKGGTADEKGTAGGLASNKPQVMNTKNVNVVGAKGATKMSSQPGHGAEKKGKPENAADKKSIVGK